MAIDEPIYVCGHAWAVRLRSKWMRLTDVLKATNDLVAVAQGALSPRVFAYGEAVVVPGL